MTSFPWILQQYVLRGHGKSSQKPSETNNKFHAQPPPSETNTRLQSRFRFFNHVSIAHDYLNVLEKHVKCCLCWHVPNVYTNSRIQFNSRTAQNWSAERGRLISLVSSQTELFASFSISRLHIHAGHEAFAVNDHGEACSKILGRYTLTTNA